MRKLENAEDRKRRQGRAAQAKKDDAAANEAAIDRMIRQNIERNGP